MPKSIFRPVNTEGGDSSGRLKKVLEECLKSSEQGFDAAKSSSMQLLSLVRQAREDLQKAINPGGELANAGEECRKQISEQYIEISDKLSEFTRLINEDIESKRNSKKAFSVIVFGRTEAGKSTLMEVLTHGDGRSIGHGRQRTTRDIREYMWEGLNVIDVPGIGAVDGEHDTELACVAAKKADMVLFLLADSPQAEEIDRFIGLRKMGKPAICIRNLKHNITLLDSSQYSQSEIEENFKFDLREIEEKFCSKNEQDYKESFLKLVREKSAGLDTEFIPVHLLLAFKAQQKEFAAYSSMMKATSRINNLINRITEEISRRGAFISFKTFTDLVSAPMTEAAVMLLNSSSRLLPLAGTFTNERLAAEEWRFHFNARAREKLESMREAFFNELSGEIPFFAERHYANPGALRLWNSMVEKSPTFKNYQNALRSIDQECTEHFANTIRSMEKEFEFFNRTWNDREFNPGPLGDSRRTWNRVFTAVGIVGSTITTFVKTIWGQAIGWGFAAVGWAGRQFLHFIPSGEERANNARMRLQNLLEESLERQSRSLNTEANDFFENQIASGKIEQGINALSSMEHAIHELSGNMRQLGLDLITETEKLNRHIISTALESISCGQYFSIVRRVARMPGKITLLALSDIFMMSSEIEGHLQNLLNEKIKIVEYVDTDLPDFKAPQYRNKEFSLKKFIAAIIGQDCQADDIFINRRENIIELYINLETYSHDIREEIKTSIILAEQITGKHIVQKK